MEKSACLACKKPQAWSLALHKLGMVAQACDLSTWGLARDSEVQGHPQPQKTFKVSLAYTRLLEKTELACSPVRIWVEVWRVEHEEDIRVQRAEV